MEQKAKKEWVIGVIGGDLRTVYAAQALSRAGVTCRLYALGEQRNPCAGGFEKGRCRAPYLLDEATEGADALLLPLPLSKDGKNLNAPLSTLNLPLSLLDGVALSDLPVFGGNLCYPPFLGRSAPTFDLLKEEDFAAANAKPTAEGALGLALLEHPGLLEESRAAILGYGNIGRSLLKKLRLLGVDCTVFARREEQRWEAAGAGARSAPFEELTDLLPSFDLVFNTVPAHVIGEERACLFQKSALYVELASAPYGMSENSRGRLPCRHLFAPGLPGKYAPLYAGRLIAKRVLAAFGAAQKEEKGRDGGR